MNFANKTFFLEPALCPFPLNLVFILLEYILPFIRLCSELPVSEGHLTLVTWERKACLSDRRKVKWLHNWQTSVSAYCCPEHMASFSCSNVSTPLLSSMSLCADEEGQSGEGSDVGAGPLSGKGRALTTCSGQNPGTKPHFAAGKLGKLFFSVVTLPSSTL